MITVVISAFATGGRASQQTTRFRSVACTSGQRSHSAQQALLRFTPRSRAYEKEKIHREGKGNSRGGAGSRSKVKAG